MIFFGFQKLTLLDYPGKTACIAFTGGCNFRCPFCHNSALVTHLQDTERVTEEEILTYLNKRRGILDGIVVTGGEPLLHADLPDFLRRVRRLGVSIKLDTNGSFPDRLKAIVREGLCDYVAMDIKNAPGNYSATAGVRDMDESAVWESADFLLIGSIPYEFRTTVVKELHTPEDIAAIARRIRGTRTYAIQPFKDSGDLVGSGCSPCSPDTLRKMEKAAREQGIPAFLRGV